MPGWAEEREPGRQVGAGRRTAKVRDGLAPGLGMEMGILRLPNLQTPVSQQLLEEEARKGLDYGFGVR